MKISPVSPDHSLLKSILWTSAIAEFVYFSLSHWFFHRFFFNALGIHGPDLESPFVVSQLQLIGAMVMGYSLLMIVTALDPGRHRRPLGVILAVGATCIAIFLGNVAAGTLPPLFLINAVLLAIQVGATLILFPAEPARRAA